MKKYILVLAMVVLGTIGLIAQPGQGSKPERGPRMAPEDRLQLTDEQTTKMEALRIDFHKLAQPMENQLGEKRAALRSLTTVENPDRKKVETLVTEIGKLENSLMLARVNHKLDVRALLDDRQKVIFDQKEPMMAHRGGQGRDGCPKN